MDANAKAQKILKELGFDFTTFTLDTLLSHVSKVRRREILTLPWEMPSTLFGAWISDEDEFREYILYRNNVSEAHQIHIQLHELSHFLFGHPTLKISRETVTKIIAGEASFPFEGLPNLRSPRLADIEIEAELLTDQIQKLVIRNSKMETLIHNPDSQEKLAYFLQQVGAS